MVMQSFAVHQLLLRISMLIFAQLESRAELTRTVFEAIEIN